ncbi:hypothetical protein [Streptomyces sp. NPDC058424]
MSRTPAAELPFLRGARHEAAQPGVRRSARPAHTAGPQLDHHPRPPEGA